MKYIIVFTLFILTSCSSQKVTLYVETWKPYCGGAKPTPEMAKGTRIPFSNQKVALYQSSKDKSNLRVFVKWIELDSLGSWKGQLKPGNYELFRSDKTLSLDELEKKYRKPDNEMYAFVGEEKLKMWKETTDFIIEVKENTSAKVELKEKCFVGLNPCMEYIGPKPR
jgi:hypothetical protein